MEAGERSGVRAVSSLGLGGIYQGPATGLPSEQMGVEAMQQTQRETHPVKRKFLSGGKKYPRKDLLQVSSFSCYKFKHE